MTKFENMTYEQIDMTSFQILWSLDDEEAMHLSGADFVRAASSQAAKAVLEAHLRAKLPHLQRLEIGRARIALAPSEDLYVE